MGWHDLMEELQRKVEATLEGIYRPQDNIPLFRVQYPPVEERQALREFQLLAERLRHRDYKVECIFLTDLYRDALAGLINCSVSGLPQKLRALEQEQDRLELQQKLSDFLPDELVKIIVGRFEEMPKRSVLILLRMGALYPFVRTSSIISKLEGKLKCTVILPYPGTTLGALLDAPSVDPHGGYYRGEVIIWR